MRVPPRRRLDRLCGSFLSECCLALLEGKQLSHLLQSDAHAFDLFPKKKDKNAESARRLAERDIFVLFFLLGKTFFFHCRTCFAKYRLRGRAHSYFA